MIWIIIIMIILAGYAYGLYIKTDMQLEQHEILMDMLLECEKDGYVQVEFDDGSYMKFKKVK